MDILVPLGIILTLFCFVTRMDVESAKSSFLWSIVITVLFCAIRYEWGPDYFGYRDAFEFIKLWGVQAFHDENDHMELGYKYYFSLFPYYFLYIAFQSTLWLSVLYWFVKDRISNHYYWLFIFILFFNVNMIVDNCVAFRTNLVSIIFLVSLKFLYEGKRLYYVVLILLSCFFHKSMIPFVLLVFLGSDMGILRKTKRIILVSSMVLLILSVAMGANLSTAISIYLIDSFPDFFGGYSRYVDQIYAVNSGLGVILLGIIKISMLYSVLQGIGKETDKSMMLIMKISVIALLALLFINENLLSRYTMTLYPILLVAVIHSLDYVRFEIKLFVILGFIYMSVSQMYQVMGADYAVSFLEFKTIFSASQIQ